MRDNLRLRLMVWITGLQAGDHAHGELAPARYREAVTRCAMTLPNMAMKLPGEPWIARFARSLFLALGRQPSP